MHYRSVPAVFRNALTSPSWICFTWVGLTAGVSFLATPVRFTAQAITRPVALDVGRVVFTALNKAELVALVLVLLATRMSGLTSRWWGICALLTLIVLAQGVWLIPELSARTDIVLAGGEPPASQHHAAYALLEVAKIGLLLYFGFSTLPQRR